MIPQVQAHAPSDESTPYAACLIGGTLAATMIIPKCQTLKPAWGRGDSRKAHALAKVFTLAMASRWYWKLDQREQHTDVERRLAREVFATNLLKLFRDDSPTGVDDFMKLDAQFNCDRKVAMDETHRGIRSEEEELLLSRALEACGCPAPLDVSRLALPVEDWRELVLAQGAQMTTSDVRDIMAVKLALIDAEIVMYETASRLYSSA